MGNNMASSPETLLLVVSHESNAARLKAALEPDGYSMETILSLDYPLQPLPAGPLSLAILWFPFSSPEMLSELENLVLQIRSLGTPDPLPVLLIIDQYGYNWVEPGFQLGVTDILTRPIHPLVLRQRVRLLLKARQTEQAVARHQAALQALGAERQMLFTVLDLLPTYVFLQDANFTIFFANRTFRQLFGDPAGHKCYAMLKQQAEPCPDCPIMHTIQTGVQQVWEWDHPNGRTYMVYDSPFVDRDGKTQVLEIGVDITERKQGELDLRREEERFRTIANFTYDWEYWSDLQGCLIYNSPSCERITGYPTRAFIENPGLLLQIVHPEDREMMRQHIQMESNSREVYSIDFRIQTASGEERWIGHVCQPVDSSQGQPLGRRVSNRDITERKQAELALVRSERLAAIGRLAASLAHEINNPLQAMYSSVELLMDFPLEGEERQQYLAIIRQEIQRLMKINDGILDFSRPAGGEPRLTDIREVVHHAVFLASTRIKTAHVEVIQDLADHLPAVLALPDQLGQVCLNLIINAVEHMPNGGQLTITARSSQDHLELSFADTGNGISIEDLGLIFEPFYTTKKEGTGLGLAISQGIIQRHNGSLSVHSTPGKGSLFTITLPLVSLPEPEENIKKHDTL